MHPGHPDDVSAVLANWPPGAYEEVLSDYYLLSGPTSWPP